MKAKYSGIQPRKLNYEENAKNEYSINNNEKNYNIPKNGNIYKESKVIYDNRKQEQIKPYNRLNKNNAINNNGKIYSNNSNKNLSDNTISKTQKTIGSIKDQKQIQQGHNFINYSNNYPTNQVVYRDSYDENKKLPYSKYSKSTSSTKFSMKNPASENKSQKLRKPSLNNTQMTQSVKQITFPNKASYISPKATISIASPNESIRQTWTFPKKFENEFRNRNYSNNFSDNIKNKNQATDLRNIDIPNKGIRNLHSRSAKVILSPNMRQSLQNYKDESITSKIVCEKFFDSVDSGEISETIFSSKYIEESTNDDSYRFSLSKIYDYDINNQIRCTLKSVSTGKKGEGRVSYSEIKS